MVKVELYLNIGRWRSHLPVTSSAYKVLCTCSHRDCKQPQPAQPSPAQPSPSTTAPRPVKLCQYSIASAHGEGTEQHPSPGLTNSSSLPTKRAAPSIALRVGRLAEPSSSEVRGYPGWTTAIPHSLRLNLRPLRKIVWSEYFTEVEGNY